MLIDLPDFCYDDLNKPDIAHNYARVFVMLRKLLLGTGDVHDRMNRAECELLNVFPDTWLGSDGVLHWRLSDEDVKLVDARVRTLVYPHSCVRVGTLHRSFWTDSQCAWKMKERMFALLVVMPTCLRGCVPPIHRAFIKLVWGLRILDGDTHSYNQCVRLGIEPGTHCLQKSRIDTAHKLIITGLSMLEGCIPVSYYPNPNPHNIHTSMHACVHNNFSNLIPTYV